VKLVYFIYGVAVYVMFVGTFAYSVGFVGNFFVPKSMDTGTPGPLLPALAMNLFLLGVFAIQHSVMARPAFKRWWTTFVPAVIERSTYILFTNLALILLFWLWRPMGPVIWDVSGSAFEPVLWGICALGWVIVFISTCLIDHFDLMGLRQVTLNLRGLPYTGKPFKTPLFYQYVRHPIYVGFTIAFWATPVMTLAHLVFAIGSTGYVVIGAMLEERDLIAHFGDRYRAYKAQVPMLIPRLRRKS